MGSCLGKIRGQNARGGGYERASRNAEDAFDSDSDTDAPLLDTEEEESRAERAASTSAPAVPKLQVEYHDDSDDELTEKPRSTVENVDVTPETLDALAEAAMRANVSSLGPDLNAPVPMNTPADGNLLDL